MGRVPGGEKGLRQLARLHGIRPEYRDVLGDRQAASPETLRSVLHALGVELGGGRDVAGALRERRHALQTRTVDPVVVARDDGPTASVVIRVPEEHAASPLSCRFAREDEPGEGCVWRDRADRLEAVAAIESEGRRFGAWRLPLPAGLPSGYHRLRVAVGGAEAEALAIVAPRRAFDGRGPGGEGRRLWGVFCPLYALHRETSWGAGDLGDLDALVEWTARRRGDLVGTLPLFAAFFDGGRDVVISPYSPASRLFWNEFYLDVARLPGLDACPAARALLESDEYRRALDDLRRDRLVDYGRQMALKRRVLEHLADAFFEGGPDRGGFEAYLREFPEVEDYAFFQAAGERHGRAWWDWPGSFRGPGRLGEVDERARRYHLYAQWRTHEQLSAVAERARSRSVAWYMDFPIGVDASSFDVWRHPGAFARGASVGSPPDSVFTRGQDWGFPPLHPDRLREQGYGYLIDAIRCQLRHAGAARIDHVMGLHRLYWIPRGCDARSGAYVSYPAEELYAILAIESERRGAWLVGENLGTVPPAVDRALRRHAVNGMHVLQYEWPGGGEGGLRTPPRPVVASVNTHDMPTFAAYWEGRDIDDRVELGLLDPALKPVEDEARAGVRRAVVAGLRDLGLLGPGVDDPGAVLRACWEWLAGTPARAVLLSLEDFWLERMPQNTPNTHRERPNWRLKTRPTFEEFADDPALIGVLERVASRRRGPARGASRGVREGPGAGNLRAGRAVPAAPPPGRGDSREGAD